MHKKTEDIFLKFHDYFVMTKKLENEFSPSKRYSRTSIPTSFSPEVFNIHLFDFFNK